MPHGTRNKQISPLKRTKTSDIQPKLNVACFVQSCLADAGFVVSSNYCLIGTRLNGRQFLLFEHYFLLFPFCAVTRRKIVDTSRIATAMLPATPAVSSPLCTAACTSPPRPRLIV